MKMSDILHSIADMLDQSESNSVPDIIDGGSDGVEVGDKMIPPLQKEIELQKQTCDDELSDIKQLSGVPRAAIIRISNNTSL